jgi:hypothetical protein
MGASVPTIEVDFETFKEITRRRPDERVSEGDVVKAALALLPDEAPGTRHAEGFWESEGVRFPVGTVLEHRFRDGRIVKAHVLERGVEVGGTTYPGLSPAGAAVTNHQLNGWRFWYVRDERGYLVAADALRRK